MNHHKFLIICMLKYLLKCWCLVIHKPFYLTTVYCNTRYTTISLFNLIEERNPSVCICREYIRSFTNIYCYRGYYLLFLKSFLIFFTIIWHVYNRQQFINVKSTGVLQKPQWASLGTTPDLFVSLWHNCIFTESIKFINVFALLDVIFLWYLWPFF